MFFLRSALVGGLEWDPDADPFDGQAGLGGQRVGCGADKHVASRSCPRAGMARENRLRSLSVVTLTEK